LSRACIQSTWRYSDTIWKNIWPWITLLQINWGIEKSIFTLGIEKERGSGAKAPDNFCIAPFYLREMTFGYREGTLFFYWKGQGFRATRPYQLRLCNCALCDYMSMFGNFEHMNLSMALKSYEWVAVMKEAIL